MDSKDFDGNAIIEAFSYKVNTFSTDEKGIKEMAERFLKEHRTLQQSMVRTIANVISAINETIKDNRYTWQDGRNEQAMKWIKAVAELDIHFPLI